MLGQAVVLYVVGSYPESSSGGMYLCKAPHNESIKTLRSHTPVTAYAVRGSLSEKTGYAFVETSAGEFGWISFKSTTGTGIGLSETNDF